MEFINSRFTGSVGLTGSLIVTGSVSVSGSITGSLFGTASYAIKAGDSFPYTGSAQITGTLYVTDEFSLGEISGSIPFTASQVISSSAADTRLSGSFSGSFYGAFVGVDTTLISSASATASINFDISGSSSLQINTDTVYVSGTFNVSESIRMYQSASVSGTNIFGTASHAVSASYFDGFVGQGVTLSFLTASTTWSVVHGLNSQFPVISIWDSSSFEVIQPDVIESKGINTTEVRFTVPRTGYANVALAGAPLYQISPFYTASFALTASFISGGVNVQDSITSSFSSTASFAVTASFVLGGTLSSSFASSSLSSSLARTSSYVAGANVDGVVSAANAATIVTTISGSAPSGSTPGSLWFDDSSLMLYVRYQDPSGSTFWVPGFNGVIGSALSASYAVTSSYTETSSYAATSAISTGFTSSFLSQSTVIVNHNLNSKALIVAVYDDLNYQVIPSSIQLSDDNNAVIQFFSVESGYVVIK